MEFKYVILDHMYAVMVPVHCGLQHKDIVIEGYSPTSAGFVTISANEVHVSGRSISLNLEYNSRDKTIIERASQ